MRRAVVLLVAGLLVLIGATACGDDGTSSDSGTAAGDLDRYLVDFCTDTGVSWCESYIDVVVEGETATATVEARTGLEAASSLCLAIGGAVFQNDPVVDASIIRIVAPNGETLVERVGIADRCG